MRLFEFARVSQFIMNHGRKRVIVRIGVKQPSRKCPTKLTLEDLKLVKLLGVGGFGKIFLAEEKATGGLYALKIQKKAKFADENRAADPFMERKVLTLASNSDFLVSMHSCFQTPERIFFVMEYCIGGDMWFHLRSRIKFTEGQVRFYAAEMVLAIQFLHKHEIIHRDISLNNFLLDMKGHIKLTDFGLCTEEFSTDPCRYKSCGKRAYSAPELVQGSFYSKAVDWWALGVCLYYMLCRKFPFEGKDRNALAQNIVNTKLYIPNRLHLQTIDILERLLCKDVRSRLGSNAWGQNTDAAVCSHIFFRGVDWNQMRRQELRPPLVPKLACNLDTRYFAINYTALPVEITPPIGEEERKGFTSDLYVNFSFVNDNFADLQ